MDSVLFGDIEVALADHLAAALAERGVEVPVVVEVPSPRPKRFVRIRRVGGPQVNPTTDNPRIVAECWDVLGTGAQSLADLVRALLNQMAPGPVGDLWVNSVGRINLSFSADPATNLPRYLVTTDLHTTGSALA